MPGEPRGAQFADVDGTRVRYVEAGDGPPVVLVHGFASSLETWATVIPELSKNHRVLAMDLKGFGWTDRPEGDYSPAAQAELVMKLAAQRGYGRAAFVGHSFGASVVLQAAIAHPDRVDKVALYDAFVFEEQIPSFFHWAKMDGVGEALFALFYKERPDERMRLAFYDKSYVTEELVDGVERALDRPGTMAAALQTVRGLRYEHVEDRYRTIDVPVLLLWGREDTVTPLQPYGERLARDLKDSRLVVYPRCGHFPMMEAAAQSNAELAEFLEPETP
jgi:pimeloyl-ACP methyl ester carboxylesterase